MSREEKKTRGNREEIEAAASFREKKPYNHREKGQKKGWSGIGEKMKVPCRGKSRTVVKKG